MTKNFNILTVIHVLGSLASIIPVPAFDGSVTLGSCGTKPHPVTVYSRAPAGAR